MQSYGQRRVVQLTSFLCSSGARLGRAGTHLGRLLQTLGRLASVQGGIPQAF